MKNAERITYMVDLFWKLLTAIVMTAFALMLIIMAIQVISRYALGMAVPWTDEASRYLFLAEIFLGSVLALRLQEHIRITVVTDMLPRPLRHLAGILADIACMLVLLMLIGGAWNMMERTAGVMASTFDMSFSYIYLVQMISALLMMGILLVNLYRRIVSICLPVSDQRRSL
ncbi:TRAP transporter small permease [Chromohalobacter beijerinckii]|uniref:TRAP transporter small permease protein n=1 Tax=Chromohalobacter beijerinckii TaxID=86179 RepID=A0ABV8XCP8_9GAMM|nr:TRAP transporter small permease [Chromohalobacter beijerinckii]CDQ34475.1 2,3-diketo-L-gulonate TRAP transporter small permease protein YiaM [Virgibacillus halodenitrificans]